MIKTIPVISRNTFSTTVVTLKLGNFFKNKMFAEKKKVQLRLEENSGGEERRSWRERLISRASLEQEAHSVEAT